MYLTVYVRKLTPMFCAQYFQPCCSRLPILYFRGQTSLGAVQRPKWVHPYINSAVGRGLCDANLEIVLFGFSPHDDVKSLIWVFCAILDTAGHVLLILVGVQPDTECSGVSSQLGLWFRSWKNRLRRKRRNMTSLPMMFSWRCFSMHCIFS